MYHISLNYYLSGNLWVQNFYINRKLDVLMFSLMTMSVVSLLKKVSDLLHAKLYKCFHNVTVWLRYITDSSHTLYALGNEIALLLIPPIFIQL